MKLTNNSGASQESHEEQEYLQKLTAAHAATAGALRLGCSRSHLGAPQSYRGHRAPPPPGPRKRPAAAPDAAAQAASGSNRRAEAARRAEKNRGHQASHCLATRGGAEPSGRWGRWRRGGRVGRSQHSTKWFPRPWSEAPEAGGAPQQARPEPHRPPRAVRTHRHGRAAARARPAQASPGRPLPPHP